MRHEIQWTICGRRYGKTFRSREAALKQFNQERLSDRVTRVELFSPAPTSEVRAIISRPNIEDATDILYVDMKRED